MNVLIIRYDFRPWPCYIYWKIISSTNKRARIYIPSREMSKLITIIYPYIVPSMDYKIYPGTNKK